MMVGNSRSRKSRTLLPHLLESTECQKRLAIQESGLNKIHHDSFCSNMQTAVSMHKPNQLGVGYTEKESLVFITRVHGTDVPANRSKMLAHPNTADFKAGELKELAVLEK